MNTPMDMSAQAPLAIPESRSEFMRKRVYGIAIFEKQEGTILFANDIFEAQIGGLARGRLFWEIYETEGVDGSTDLSIKDMLFGESVAMEMKQVHTEKRYELLLTSLIHEGVPAYLTVVKEFRERRAVENELIRVESKFQMIFQNSPVGIAHFDCHGVITDCNESYLQIIGSPKEKNIGFDLLTDTVNMQYQQAVTQALGGHVGFFEGRYTTVTSQKNLILKVECGPCRGPDGVLDGGILIIEDYTEHEATKIKLQAHHREMERLATDLKKFELAVKNGSDAICITDREGVITYANPMVELLTGHPKKELIGQTISRWGQFVEDKIHGQHIPFHQVWEQILTSNTSFTGELVSQHRSGRVYITKIQITPVLNEEHQPIFFVVTEWDITKMKEADRAKTEFVSLASHQLRTPLTGIRLATELLQRGLGGEVNESQQDYLGEISQSTKEMTSLIDDLLNVSRIEMGTFTLRPEPLHIVHVTEEILRNLKEQLIKKNLQVECLFEKAFPRCVLDKHAITLIIDNLITNAIRYTPEQGRIVIRGRVKKHVLILQVTDTGYGVPLGENEKIFERFFRATNAQTIDPEGKGLGLYIVQSMTNSLGGKIWSEANTDGPGTTFTVIIPLTVSS